MRCDEAQSELLLGRAPGASTALATHVEGCERCRALAEQHNALNAVLALDEPHRPGPGFDTRFFARLAGEREATRRRRRLFSLRMGLWALIPAAAGVALLVARTGREPSEQAVPPEAQAPAALIEAIAEGDLALVMDEDPALLEDLAVLQQLDELEDLELLDGVDPAELDRIAAEAAP
jgi:hypothetical protein